MARVNLREVLSSRHPKVGKTVFIAVDGRGGSGKSTLAKWLAEHLNAQIVRTDDFASWDNPLDWWPLLIERVFQPIKNGATTLNYPRSKWWENRHPEPVLIQPVTEIMILEGVSSSRKEFHDYISLNIFVDAPRDTCLRRGVARDSVTGKTEEELTEMWEDWFEEEDKYMRRDQPQQHADIVLDGTKPFEDQISVREDSAEMKSADVIELIQLLEQNDIEVYIDGGWGVDALLGVQTRPHSDLDIALPHKYVPQLRKLLTARGYEELPRNDARDCNFVLGDAKGHQLDVHSYTFDDDGRNIQGIAYMPEHLTGPGSIGGYSVKCLSPEWMVKFHSGYEVDQNDYRDVFALCQRFGFSLPTEYEKFAK